MGKTSAGTCKPNDFACLNILKEKSCQEQIDSPENYRYQIQIYLLGFDQKLPKLL